MTTQVGLIEWLDNTAALKHVIAKQIEKVCELADRHCAVIIVAPSPPPLYSGVSVMRAREAE
jgi:hypothetical protein